MGLEDEFLDPVKERLLELAVELLEDFYRNRDQMHIYSGEISPVSGEKLESTYDSVLELLSEDRESYANALRCMLLAYRSGSEFLTVDRAYTVSLGEHPDLKTGREAVVHLVKFYEERLTGRLKIAANDPNFPKKS